MEMQAYIEDVRLKLTGNVVDLDIEDSVIEQIVNSSFREVQRYIDCTKLATIKYSPCIDLSEFPVSAIAAVFRAKGYLMGASDHSGAAADPLYMSQWQIFGGNGGMANATNWVLNYAAWNTALQLRNTTSTDLMFRYDAQSGKLYVNCAFDKPEYITIEYIPKFTNVNQIKSDFWIDILLRLAVANTKVIVGRIRSKFTQANALWTLDGQQLLEEGNKELDELREQLRVASAITYPID